MPQLLRRFCSRPCTQGPLSCYAPVCCRIAMPKDKDDDRKDHERTVQSVVYYRTDAFVSWLLKDVWALPESSCFYAFYVVCIPLFVLFLTTVTVFPALVFALHTQPVASALCSWVWLSWHGNRDGSACRCAPGQANACVGLLPSSCARQLWPQDC